MPVAAEPSRQQSARPRPLRHPTGNFRRAPSQRRPRAGPDDPARGLAISGQPQLAVTLLTTGTPLALSVKWLFCWIRPDANWALSLELNTWLRLLSFAVNHASACPPCSRTAPVLGSTSWAVPWTV